ncbi:glycosyltransferase involved in cell wall biosynthesis [Wenyingzhuangia heitensis]|uniref:Glycosyltransferase involved in cell wall biosynthesis n=1 Tax=Wenyingzhuangia heitensis TaxID=1487859 RepID=A0ABX0UAN6_9FLAO|nr:glycosyltransferase [Wenyingzhuangia heitensis]NIJ45429.1 glycosyltransferase involved in cell wall biosynthesis [Wenyingzhuangia heitensis]
MIKFSIVITTKNRIIDLQQTITSLSNTIKRKDVELLVCDDASTDGTGEYLKKNNWISIVNKKSEGLIHNRNILNNKAKGVYIISLDDDAQFLSENVLEEIESCFIMYPKCGVQNLRIFWGKEKPSTIASIENYELNKGFVGCGHVWRKSAWESIAQYPAWFIFYGEEDFAAFQLFKQGWDILYNPKVLVHHRVDVKSRKKQKDYRLRLRRSFRSGWYLYLLFYPIKEIPRRLAYTFWQQIKKKTLKGDVKATIAISQAVFDVIYNFPRLMKNSNRLTSQEFLKYQQLPDTKMYWKPKEN